MKFTSATILTAAASALQAAAHGGVIGYSINGVYYGGFKAYNTATGQSTIQREWDSYNPITDTTSTYLSCNTLGSIMPGTGQLSASTTAGAKVTAYWNTPWPHTVGPVMVYMAKCASTCSTQDTSQANWFKIQEGGLLSGTVGNGQWAMGQLVTNNNSWTTTLPSTLAAGEYLLRHELLAIHTSNQPQFYPECAQLKITTGGSAVGTPTVKFPGGYSATDPSIDINIYAAPASTAVTYAIPGPTVFTG